MKLSILIQMELSKRNTTVYAIRADLELIRAKSVITSAAGLLMVPVTKLTEMVSSAIQSGSLRNASLPMWLEESESRLSAERAF